MIVAKARAAARPLEALRRDRTVPVAPGRTDRPGNPDLDRARCRRRDPIERLAAKLERFRRAATRCGKPAAHRLAPVRVASAPAPARPRTLGGTS